ncbi:fumarylacetoacetate hydrolase family protein [Bacillus sp. 2205SS5-2]|uniref:fumarylacetoacetate hydrolase family protein n=1 Tax=Bacillus sp. 2205SS5-2 TaxID=3109031 RepID=UPI0030069D2E
MKWVTFINPQGLERAGWLLPNGVVDMHRASGGELPKDLLSLIQHFGKYEKKVKDLFLNTPPSHTHREVTLLAPLPRPVSFRDFYAFEEHVKTAREKRGLSVVDEWYEIPVFYFSNHLSIRGPQQKIIAPKECKWLDYELEVACVIGAEGRNISKESADKYIFGYCILNDWSARDLQRQEMKVGLGPAKGKDFATSIGPYIITPDELEKYKTDSGYHLEMIASVNGQLLSKGNLADIYYSFSEMIERASTDITLYPGELIGSGTVGSGCILELGTDVHRWLQSGDEVELRVTGLGVLKNKVF